MRNSLLLATDVVVAVLCLVGAVLSWRCGLHTTVFARSGDTPGFEATRYAAPWLLLAAVLVTVGGVVAIDGIARAARIVRSDVAADTRI
ncbi:MULTISPECIES: hypothetical protein [unclassified Nocardia]|uniref:hypothetical protein n=1 Tax=unclassified Nocardia TaxID=2637762 RepID=UPI001CE45B9B|nr:MULTISPECIES: hypothetical protein [unclassified Nocardia]